jgi:hypothetical protein
MTREPRYKHRNDSTVLHIGGESALQMKKGTPCQHATTVFLLWRVVDRCFEINVRGFDVVKAYGQAAMIGQQWGHRLPMKRWQKAWA